MVEQGQVKRSENEVVDAAAANPNGVLVDPILARTMDEDPLFKFIKNNYRQVVFTIVAVAAAIYAYQTFSEARHDSKSSMSDQFDRVREQFSAWEETTSQLRELEAKRYDDKNAADKEKDQKRKVELADGLKKSTESLRGAVRALGDNGAPYDRISKIYEGLIARSEGNLEMARAALTSNWKEVPPDAPERLYTELAALTLSRGMLDQLSEADKAREMLKDLAVNGKFVYVSSALTLAQIASNQDQVKQAISLLEEIKSKSPKQAELISPELERLKNR